MPFVIVETAFDPPITQDEFDEMAAKTSKCLEEREAHWLTSYFSVDRRRRICVFDAKDAESVRQAYRTSGAQFERVWTADQILADDD
jgi:predicted RNA-binding protein with PIN domain